MAKTFISPAARILGTNHPCVRAGRNRLVELESPEDEIARDRRTLGRLAGGAAGLGVAGALIIRKGRLPVKAAAAAVPAVKVPSAKGVPKKMPKAKKTSNIERPTSNAEVKGRKRKAATNLEEKRDRLSKVRDGAVIGGTGAVGVGSLVVAGQARKLRKQAGDAIGYAGSSISRAAKEVKREVTPERVAREGLKLVKKKAKEKAVEYFPTFTKAGKLLKKTVFSAGGGDGGWQMADEGFQTPAQRMGIEFATREQLRNKDTDVYANPLRVAAGVEKAYRPGPGKTKIEESLPIGNAQVIRAAVNKAESINKWGTRGGRLAKDAVDVVRGKGRGRDASGRKKKREWEKSWAQNAAKKAVITAGVLGYATGLKKSPGFRAANVKIAGKIKKKVNEYVPDAFPERRFAGMVEGGWEMVDGRQGKAGLRQDAAATVFETPARRLGITFLAKRESDPRKDAAAGAVAGGLNGAIAGGVAPVLGKEGTEWGKLNSRQRAAEAAVGDEMAHGGSWKKKKAKGAFAKGKFGRGERLARAESEASSRLKKAVKRGALKGGLAGAAVLGAAGYGLGKLTAGPKRPAKSGEQRAGSRKKAFAAALERVTEFDEVAEGAGWDIRDPRGRSARVFAPGSRKRNRREKMWHEKAENERKLWKAAVATAAVGGGAAGLVLSKGVKNGPAGAAVARLRKLKK